MKIPSVLSGLVLCGVLSAGGQTLRLETVIPLPGVEGRIDHLAVDAAGARLFVAALGNNTLEVVDLKGQRRVRGITGLAEPQGVAYLPALGRLLVAGGADGSVRAFEAGTGKLVQSIAYGDDADNLRVDPSTGHLWVGFGGGALGEFTAGGERLGEIRLDAHPESFQLERNGPRVFINVPRLRKIVVADRVKRTVTGEWHTGTAQANYPMALDERNRRLFVATRTPARLFVLDTADGRVVASLAAAGDCDDVFYDARRRRIYAIGGEGAISVFEQRDADHYVERERVTTVAGARTGLFAVEMDRLFVAARRHEAQPAAIRVYAPVP